MNRCVEKLGSLGPFHLTFTVYDIATILVHVNKTAFLKILCLLLETRMQEKENVMTERKRKEEKKRDDIKLRIRQPLRAI